MFTAAILAAALSAPVPKSLKPPPSVDGIWELVQFNGLNGGLIYEYDFDRAAAESAAAFVPPDREQLNLCHARWETGGF